jgi:hypothetical protein
MKQALGWDSVYAFNQEDFGPDSLLGRMNDEEVVLTRPLREAATRLLATLGYRSDRTLAMDGQPESMMYRIKMLLYNILDKVCIMWNDPTSIKNELDKS